MVSSQRFFEIGPSNNKSLALKAVSGPMRRYVSYCRYRQIVYLSQVRCYVVPCCGTPRSGRKNEYLQKDWGPFPMRVILSKPRGFCAGVVRAIGIVELALKKYGPPVYVRHEIVHNKRVVEDLKAKGAVFVEELDEVPDGAHTVFSAHGVSQKIADVAENRDF